MSDGTVAFKCDRNAEKWPWLNLPPAHPIVIQTINFWASVETGITRGTFDPSKWSALTYSKWEAGSGDTGPVTHGFSDLPAHPQRDNKPGFRITFFDDAGNLVCRLIGAGVIFQTRDFESWRNEAKEQAAAKHSIRDFEYAEKEALGVTSDVERFLSPLVPGNTPQVCALVSDENGLMPKHPYHSGSGDHVNANHLVDAGFQFAHLLLEKPLQCVGGEMKFRHYVELGKPFTLTATDVRSCEISVQVHQGESHCTDINLKFAGYTTPA